MGPQRNVLIAVALVLLVAVGLTVYRISDIPALEPQPLGASNGDKVPPVPAKAPIGESTSPRAVAAPLDRSGSEGATAIAPGRVRGQIDAAPGETFPAQFELVIETAPAAPRVLSFTAADRIVALDLPQGRSILCARAEGLASRQVVLLRESQAPIPPFRLLLEPASRLGGQVLDARGAPLAGLPVSLVATTYRDVRTLASDSSGRYEFSDIPIGAYRVAFGSSDSPIAPVVPVELVKGEVRDVAPQTMPDLGEGEIRVLDRAGAPVEGARVFGAGQRGGWIDAVSDTNGIVRARFLPAGTFFLDVAAANGMRGQGPLEIEAGRLGRAVVQVRN